MSGRPPITFGLEPHYAVPAQMTLELLSSAGNVNQLNHI